MSNERIEQITEDTVTFKYKDSNDRSIEKKMTLYGEEFIRRFMLHVLPKGFMKIRYYGVFAGRNKNKRMERLKIITKTKQIVENFLSKIELLNKINGFDVTKCRYCNEGGLMLIKVIPSTKPPN